MTDSDAQAIEHLRALLAESQEKCRILEAKVKEMIDFANELRDSPVGQFFATEIERRLKNAN